MKKTFEQPKKLTLNKTTIALLGNNSGKHIKGANNFGASAELSTLPACDITNTSGLPTSTPF